MDMDFSLILLIAVAISGCIWLFDYFVLAPPRREKVVSYLQSKGKTEESYKEYFDEENGENADNNSVKTYENAYKLEMEPIPVEYAKSFFPVLLAVLIIRSFLIEPFQIPTGSMIPTLKVGDFIVVNKFSYGIRLPVIGTKVINIGEPERGDVMVFIPPHDPTFYIKRVVGMPGDHIRYEDKQVFVNGEPIEQEFVAMIQEGTNPVIYHTEQLGEVNHDIHTVSGLYRPYRSGNWLPPEGRVIPDGHYFMMGDNRDNSEDSRYWGPVSEDKIIGRAVAVWMHKEPGFTLPSFSQSRLINP